VLIGVSAITAILLTHLILPEVNALIKKDIAISSMYQAEFVVLTILCLIVIGLFSGWYPAWLTAKIQPATAVKASYSFSDNLSNWLRKGLVVAQFSLSAGLLLAMIIMSRQMKYFHEANLGFDRENILSFQMPDLKNKDLLEVELAKISGIQQSIFSLGSPAGDNTWTTVMHPTSLNDPERKNVRTIWADQFYQEIFGLEVLAGRFINMSDTSFISSSIPDEEHTPKVVVNETLVKEMGFGTLEEALGKRFLVGVNNWKVEVVGVMKDFNISSLHNEIMPLAIGVYPKQHKEVSIQLAKNIDLPATLREIEAAYTTAFPKNIFQFDFLDDKIERYYESESRLFSLFRIFSWLAMLISCLGLWGLATFATIQRTKEIGIRKVLGASSSMLVGLLSRDFFLMVGVSFLLGAPIAWYRMNGWLQNFAYQIPVHWTIFALSAMAILLIVSTTIGYQTLKAALSDPVKALRYE
ncbi:MAG: FtsX-like permease family protein, partial [Bacteroidota bacterium]